MIIKEWFKLNRWNQVLFGFLRECTTVFVIEGHGIEVGHRVRGGEIEPYVQFIGWSIHRVCW